MYIIDEEAPAPEDEETAPEEPPAGETDPETPEEPPAEETAAEEGLCKKNKHTPLKNSLRNLSKFCRDFCIERTLSIFLCRI